jgi:Protein of unknown function (DUF2877)
VRLSAAASSSLRPVLAGPARPATWLGATPAAMYLQLAGDPGVLALLAHDAVRLPCALLLPTTRAELPLTSLGPAVGTPVVGDGVVAWTGPAGPVVVRAVREWAPTRARGGTVVASALTAVRTGLPGPEALGIEAELVARLTSDPAQAVARLLGCGPGLTPAGDDVLAGFLVAARAFGLDASRMRAVTAALAPRRTTALSAALLWHAARGECIDEVAAVVAALTGHGHPEPAIERLLTVGHTSGGALAVGLAAAATANVMAVAPPTLYRQQSGSHDISGRIAGEAA